MAVDVKGGERRETHKSDSLGRRRSSPVGRITLKPKDIRFTQRNSHIFIYIQIYVLLFILRHVLKRDTTPIPTIFRTGKEISIQPPGEIEPAALR